MKAGGSGIPPPSGCSLLTPVLVALPAECPGSVRQTRIWFLLQAGLRSPASSSLFTLCPRQWATLSGLHLFLGASGPRGLGDGSSVGP